VATNAVTQSACWRSGDYLSFRKYKKTPHAPEVRTNLELAEAQTSRPSVPGGEPVVGHWRSGPSWKSHMQSTDAFVMERWPAPRPRPGGSQIPASTRAGEANSLETLALS
jgi:hypothetical protein